MSAGHPVSLLMFGTLAIALIIAIAMLLWFLRKGENRHPMSDVRERNIDEIRDGRSPGEGR